MEDKSEDKAKENWERIFAVFELEYKQTAERFENIYKAIWQIFSYMAILAAGILTFGSRNSTLRIEAIVFIGLTPLVFWFLAIYIPMNHYGKQTGKDLEKIEENFNNISKRFLDPPWQLTHYINFASRNNDKKENSDSLNSKPSWSVQNAVYFFGVIIFSVWVFLGIILLTLFLFRVIPYSINLLQLQKPNSEKIELKLEPVEITMQKPRLQELESKLDSLYQKIDFLESLIRETKANPDRQ